MSDITQTSFNYAELSTETELELRLSAERIRTRMKRTAEDIVEIGHELIDAKARLNKTNEEIQNKGYGQFGSWLQSEFGMTDRTARNFMQVAEKFPKISEKFSEMSPSILYMLASPTESVRETVIAQVQSGEIAPNVRDVKAAIAEAKEQERRAKEAQAQAEAQARTLQQQLLEADQATKTQVMAAQNRVYTITRQLEEAQAQIANHIPYVVTETVEVVPPELRAKLAKLETDLAEAKRIQKGATEAAKQLQEEAHQNVLRNFANGDDLKIRNAWFSTYAESLRSVRAVYATIPSASTLKAWEYTDWQRARELLEAIARLKHAYESLLANTNLTVIDAE